MNFAETVLPSVLAVVIPVLGTFLTGLASLALYKLSKKFGFQALAQENRLFTDLVAQLVGAAERWAIDKVKAGDRKPLGREKLEWVVAQVLRVFPERSRGEVEAYVLAALKERDDFEARWVPTERPESEED